MKTNMTLALTAVILACLVGIPQANAQSGAGFAQEIREFSKKVGCGQMAEKDASEYAGAASSGKLNVARFKEAFNVSCAFRASMEAVKDEAEAAIFQKVLRMSKSNSRCPGLSGDEALQVARAALKGEIKVHQFAVAYFSSCTFEGPFAVAHMLTIGPAMPGAIMNLKDLEREESTRTEKLSKEDEELRHRWAEIELRHATEEHSAE